MDDRLRRYIEGLFKDVGQTKNMIELQEEMLQNLKEKYEDLIREGKTEEAAFNIAVAGIGDISSLINDMEKDRGIITDMDNVNKAKQKSAMLTSAAVMLYILSVVPIMIVLNSYRMDFFYGVIGFFIMITIATGLLVYNGMTKPKYTRVDDTMVEEFKEWQTNKSNKAAARISISVALWCVLIALYFIISFTTFAWYITWIIFIIGIAIEALINIFYISKK